MKRSAWIATLVAVTTLTAGSAFAQSGRHGSRDDDRHRRPEHPDRDRQAGVFNLFDEGEGLLENARAEESLSGEGVDAGADGIFLLPVLVGQADLGQGLEQAVGPHGVEVQLTRQLAAANGMAG